MVLAGGVPAVVQLVGLVVYLDESPRWLVSKGRHVDARRVLSRIYPMASEDQVSRQVEKIDLAMRSDVSLAPLPNTTATLKSQLSDVVRDPTNRKALILACGLQAGQQLTGANSILYYSSRLLLLAGFRTNPNSAAVAVAVANFIGTALAMRFVDRWGRRRLLLSATAVAAVCLALLALALGMIDTGDVVDDALDQAAGTAADVGKSGGPWPYLCLSAMVLFLFFYALGLGIVPVSHLCIFACQEHPADHLSPPVARSIGDLSRSRSRSEYRKT